MDDDEEEHAIDDMYDALGSVGHGPERGPVVPGTAPPGAETLTIEQIQ